MSNRTFPEHTTVNVIKDDLEPGEKADYFCADDYICYMIHEMMDSRIWSLPDILLIENIWVNVEVTHQYYTRVPKWGDAKAEG